LKLELGLKKTQVEGELKGLQQEIQAIQQQLLSTTRMTDADRKKLEGQRASAQVKMTYKEKELDLLSKREEQLTTTLPELPSAAAPVAPAAPAVPPVPPTPPARVIPLGVPDGGSVHLGGNPPTPPARVIPSSGVPGTTPAPPVAPPAPPAPAAPATLLPDSTGVKFRVKGAAERLEMTVNTSRVVEFPFDVPRMLVNNPDLARVVPISPRSIQVAAVRAGVTQLNAWDANDNVTTVDLTVLGDDT
jgi:hypothetical protein